MEESRRLLYSFVHLVLDSFIHPPTHPPTHLFQPVYALARALQLGYETVVFIDSDALFAHMEMSIEEILDVYTNKKVPTYPPTHLHSTLAIFLSTSTHPSTHPPTHNRTSRGRRRRSISLSQMTSPSEASE